MTRTELLEHYLRPTDLTIKELFDRNAFAQIMQFAEAYRLEQLRIDGVSKRFDFDKLLQDYRQEFVNGGGYVKSDTFESGTEPYEVFEWFKKKLS